MANLHFSVLLLFVSKLKSFKSQSLILNELFVFGKSQILLLVHITPFNASWRRKVSNQSLINLKVQCKNSCIQQTFGFFKKPSLNCASSCRYSWLLLTVEIIITLLSCPWNSSTEPTFTSVMLALLRRVLIFWTWNKCHSKTWSQSRRWNDRL